jgi:DNA-directed RNA polymerase specialized sigma24 family protein
MKAVRLHKEGGPEQLVYEDAPKPQLGAGDALIRVHATGITPAEILTAALDEPPPKYRSVVVLRDVEGLSHRDIGDFLGITVASATTRVHRARLFLRKRLAGVHGSGQCGLEYRDLARRDRCYHQAD